VDENNPPVQPGAVEDNHNPAAEAFESALAALHGEVEEVVDTQKVERVVVEDTILSNLFTAIGNR
jgi:hypothetical protein